MPDVEQEPDVLGRVMSLLYTASTLLLCAYIADVLLDGAVTRAAQPLARRAGTTWMRITDHVRRDRAWREGTPWVIWEATEATMAAAEEGR